MSVIEAPSADAIEYTLDDFWPLSIEQYHQMIREGILTEDDPVELLHGRLTRKMPKNPPHRLATRRTRLALEACLPAGWFVEAQEPITTEDSEPEPHITVVRGSPDDYAERHPGPRDVALVVEVADGTLQRDRSLKKKIYASAGVPVYWVLNLLERRLEVYAEPRDGAYTRLEVFAEDSGAPVHLDEVRVGPVQIARLLP